MKIAFDISSSQITQAGTTTYVVELVRALRRIAPENCFIEFSYIPKFKRSSRILRAFDTLYRETLWLNLVLPKRVYSSNVDVIHMPVPYAPLNIRRPMVVTVHDVYIFRNPKFFPFWHQLMARFYMSKIIEKTDMFITVSHFTKSEFLNIFGAELENKTVVVHEGVSKRFQVISPEYLSNVASKFSLLKPFILSVCTIEPRKNLERLIKAYSLIKDVIEHDLVVIGPYGWKSGNLFELIKYLKIEARIKFLGFINSVDLPSIYNLADLFVYPSLYEGFGLPPLEAMACGCPVITSNVSSLPEIIGEAGIMIDPQDVYQFAKRIQQVLEDKKLAQNMRSRGLEHAKIFSWERCAEKTLNVYRQVLES